MTIRVGLVGTGYAASVRVEAFLADSRSTVMVVASRDKGRTVEFASRYGIDPAEHWIDLVEDTKIDLVVVATVSGLHGDVVEADLKAGKHVVVEYPLSLDLVQAERLLMLAEQRSQLLHVEHVELLGGLHQEIRSHLSLIGCPGYLNYCTLSAQRPAPMNWKYCPELFGFPFCGALSRVNRLTSLFGLVRSVSCELQMTRSVVDSRFYTNVLCSGRLLFTSGLVAELTYGKGDNIWSTKRAFEVHGSDGSLTFVGNKGTLVTRDGETQIEAAPRRGLIALDTQRVMDYLSEGAPLYVSAKESLYALRVGDALRRAAAENTTIVLE